MLNRFLNLFRDPEDSDPSFIRLVRNLLVFAIAATLASAGVVMSTSNTGSPLLTISTLSGLFLLELIALAFVLRERVLPAKLIVPPGLVIAFTVLASNGNTIHDISILAFPLIIMVGNILQGRRALYVTTPLAIAAISILGYLDMSGRSTSPIAARTGIDDILIATVLLFSGAGILHLLARRPELALNRARANEQEKVKTNRELLILQESLEKRIFELTNELEFANQRNEKRAKQFEAIAQVARATTRNEKLDTLLPRLTELISEQFGFYHTGIFLIDEDRTHAVLRAANSEGGRRMLGRGHKLQVGQTGMVGFVSAMGTPRIALDVGDDAVFFDNPDLPNTRSEMALPLRTADQIIGVLDVQSMVSNVFQEEDIEVLSTLADQVAVAIQNAHTYERMQELLDQARRISGSYLDDAWRILQSEESMTGYRIAGEDITPLMRPLASMQVRKAMKEKQTIVEHGKNAVLAIPIRLRNEVIGVMDIRTPNEHDWDEDEVDIAEAVADRLSLALETSLLLKSTQRRAEIERITTNISGKISATTQFDSILRTAAEELSRVFGGSEVLVQIQTYEKSGSNANIKEM